MRNLKKLIFVLMLGLILGIATSASAVSVSATATGDNWLWIWQQSAWTPEGANYGNWEKADTTTFSGLPYGQSVDFYFAVMNATPPAGATYANPGGLLAQLSGVTFKETGTSKLLSNTASYWKVAAVGTATWGGTGWDGIRPIEFSGGIPTDPVFNPTTTSFGWVAPTSYGANNAGGNPWGPVISGIDGTAEWIWTANNWQSATPDQLAVFRVTATPIPEPASTMLLGMGLIGFAGRVIRRKFTA